MRSRVQRMLELGVELELMVSHLDHLDARGAVEIENMMCLDDVYNGGYSSYDTYLLRSIESRLITVL